MVTVPGISPAKTGKADRSRGLRAWLLELLGLPATAEVGFVTGGMMANFTCLAAARDDVLHRAGWDVTADGLQGAETVSVVVGEERHDTIDVALRYLGLGEARSHRSRPRRTVVHPGARNAVILPRRDHCSGKGNGRDAHQPSAALSIR